MNLYHVQFDSQSWWVEAPTFAAAIEAWHSRVRAEWGDDYDGTEQPDSVAHVHDGGVIRCETAPVSLSPAIVSATTGTLNAATPDEPDWLRLALDLPFDMRSLAPDEMDAKYPGWGKGIDWDDLCRNIAANARKQIGMAAWVKPEHPVAEPKPEPTATEKLRRVLDMRRDKCGTPELNGVNMVHQWGENWQHECFSQATNDALPDLLTAALAEARDEGRREAAAKADPSVWTELLAAVEDYIATWWSPQMASNPSRERVYASIAACKQATPPADDSEAVRCLRALIDFWCANPQSWRKACERHGVSANGSPDETIRAILARIGKPDPVREKAGQAPTT